MIPLQRCDGFQEVEEELTSYKYPTWEECGRGGSKPTILKYVVVPGKPAISSAALEIRVRVPISTITLKALLLQYSMMIQHYR